MEFLAQITHCHSLTEENSLYASIRGWDQWRADGIKQVEERRKIHTTSFAYDTHQTPLALKASEIKENNAISHLTDDNNILYPLLPSDTLDQ